MSSGSIRRGQTGAPGGAVFLIPVMAVSPTVAILDEPPMVTLAARGASITAGVAIIRVTRMPDSPSS